MSAAFPPREGPSTQLPPPPTLGRGSTILPPPPGEGPTTSSPPPPAWGRVSLAHPLGELGRGDMTRAGGAAFWLPPSSLGGGPPAQHPFHPWGSADHGEHPPNHGG